MSLDALPLPMCERFAANLRTAREEAYLTPEELADRAELDLSDLSAFERGEDLPLADAAARIIAVLDISFAELVEGITWNPETRRFEIDT